MNLFTVNPARHSCVEPDAELAARTSDNPYVTVLGFFLELFYCMFYKKCWNQTNYALVNPKYVSRKKISLKTI